MNTIKKTTMAATCGAALLACLALEVNANGPDRILLPVDQIENQTHGNGCGPCSAARLLRYHKKPMTYRQAYADINPAGWGSTPASIVNFLQKHGLADAHEERKSNFNRVLEVLGQGRPCIALVEDGGSFRLHWIVLQGYDKAKGHVYFMDTNGQPMQYNSFRDFNSNWDWRFGIFGWGNGVLSVRGVHGRTIITTGPRPPEPPPPPMRPHHGGK
jgi:hypothetical protein